MTCKVLQRSQIVHSSLIDASLCSLGFDKRKTSGNYKTIKFSQHKRRYLSSKTSHFETRNKLVILKRSWQQLWAWVIVPPVEWNNKTKLRNLEMVEIIKNSYFCILSSTKTCRKKISHRKCQNNLLNWIISHAIVQRLSNL